MQAGKYLLQRFLGGFFFALSQSGLVYTEEEWQKEWNELIKLASSEPRVHYGTNGSGCSGYVGELPVSVSGAASFFLPRAARGGSPAGDRCPVPACFEGRMRDREEQQGVCKASRGVVETLPDPSVG